MKPLKNRILRAIRSGKIRRMARSPAEQMDDFSLATVLVRHYPPEALESWLEQLQHGQRIWVAGTPPYRPEEAPELLEKLQRFAAATGGSLHYQPAGEAPSAERAIHPEDLL